MSTPTKESELKVFYEKNVKFLNTHFREAGIQQELTLQSISTQGKFIRDARRYFSNQDQDETASKLHAIAKELSEILKRHSSTPLTQDTLTSTQTSSSIASQEINQSQQKMIFSESPKVQKKIREMIKYGTSRQFYEHLVTINGYAQEKGVQEELKKRNERFVKKFAEEPAQFPLTSFTDAGDLSALTDVIDKFLIEKKRNDETKKIRDIFEELNLNYYRWFHIIEYPISPETEKNIRTEVNQAYEKRKASSDGSLESDKSKSECCLVV